MKIHDLVQGSPEWHAYRAEHDNASDAPAMLGCSPHMSRAQLLHQKHTGLRPEPTAEQERIYADGHSYEAQARPLAELIIGESLYPVVGSEGSLSASFDGITMGEDIVFEHKSLNEALRACMPVNDGVTIPEGVVLPKMYRVQNEQQLAVSAGRRVLFMASKWNGDQLVEERHCWYDPDPALREEIRLGWVQFHRDLEAYEPPAAAGAVVVAKATTALPAVSVSVSGSIVVKDNFRSFEAALRDFIDNRLIREPSTDQDFADLGLQIDALKKAESALDAAEAQMLSQVEAVDTAKRTKDMLLQLARENRLMAEKLLEAKKIAIRGEIVAGGMAAFAEHLRSMNCAYLPRITADFAGAIKGKRTLASLRDACDTELARVKIEANGHYQRITQNLKTLSEVSDVAFLFSDVGALALKQPDDLALVIRTRIADHRAQEEKRLQAERERIRVEEEMRAQQRVEAARIDEQRRQANELARANEAKAAAAPPPAPIEAPAPTGILDRGESPAGKALVKAMAPPPAPKRDEPATLNLGAIGERLEFTVNAALMAKFGFDGAPGPRGSKLFTESQFYSLCNRLLEHVARVRDEATASA